jgi:hypothetical protein
VSNGQHWQIYCRIHAPTLSDSSIVVNG